MVEFVEGLLNNREQAQNLLEEHVILVTNGASDLQ